MPTSTKVILHLNRAATKEARSLDIDLLSAANAGIASAVRRAKTCTGPANILELLLPGDLMLCCHQRAADRRYDDTSSYVRQLIEQDLMASAKARAEGHSAHA